MRQHLVLDRCKPLRTRTFHIRDVSSNSARRSNMQLRQALESLVRQHLHMTALDNYKDYVRREKY